MSLSKKILGQEIDQRIQDNADRRNSQFGGDLNEMGKYWAQRTADTLKANLTKKNIRLTGELIDSVSWMINEGDPPGVSIFFAVHGRILEMKSVFWHKAPPYEAMLSWVKKKPIGFWAYVPGYEYRGMNGIPAGMDQNKAQSRIAWALVKSRSTGEAFNQYGKWKKKKQWQNPGGKGDKSNLNTAIAHLIHLLEEEISAAASGIIVTAIKQ